jgi:hypothetical protein
MVRLCDIEQASRYYDEDLEIAHRLALAEPDRTDYQRDLRISYERLEQSYSTGPTESMRTLCRWRFLVAMNAQ